MTETEKPEKIDYLEEDPVIRSQRYALLSLVLPHNMVQKRELFYVQEFFKKTCERLKLSQEEAADLYEEFENFKQVNGEEIDRVFSEANENQTSIAGLKIRGVYETETEARSRAKSLQRNDPDFNVFLADVGKWLPISPSVEYHIDNEEYLDDQLNDLMCNYKKNKAIKDDFYAAQKREKVEAARREGKQGNIKVSTVETVKQALDDLDHQARKESFQRDTKNYPTAVSIDEPAATSSLAESSSSSTNQES